MPRPDYVRCRNCKREREQTGPLSHTRLCAECSVERLAENAYSIHAKAGPAYHRRQYGIALREFGPRVALALRQAGVFDESAFDDALPRS